MVTVKTYQVYKKLRVLVNTLDRKKKVSYLVPMETSITAGVCSAAEIRRAVEVLHGTTAVVLSGAGISTDSGIPDYRGPETIKKNRKPVLHGEFVEKEEARQRYWSRSFFGWPRVRDAGPNRCHRITAELEEAGFVSGVITQNVDSLHQAAGSSSVIELHGTLEQVVCLVCGGEESRDSVQGRLAEYNPEFRDAAVSEIAPDGDIDLPPEATRGFRTPRCLLCGGVLKPDVVFFGDSVPAERVCRAQRMVAASDALLVLGSSLTVFSGFRFVKQARAEDKPIVIITIGHTRGDKFAAVKLNAPLCSSLEKLQQHLLY